MERRARRSRGGCASVPLIDQAAKALDALSRRERFTGEDDLVFVDALDGHVDDWRLRRRFHDALDRAGLKRLRLHDLRHTFGTLAVQAFPLTDVKAFMGHADIATTMIYIHHVPQIDAADRLSRLVAAAESVPRLRPVSGHVRDTVADSGEAPEPGSGSDAAVSEWARQDSNLGHTDYETHVLATGGYPTPPTPTS
jgi:Phage integrase family